MGLPSLKVLIHQICQRNFPRFFKSYNISRSNLYSLKNRITIQQFKEPLIIPSVISALHHAASTSNLIFSLSAIVTNLHLQSALHRQSKSNEAEGGHFFLHLQVNFLNLNLSTGCTGHVIYLLPFF